MVVKWWHWGIIIEVLSVIACLIFLKEHGLIIGPLIPLVWFGVILSAFLFLGPERDFVRSAEEGGKLLAHNGVGLVLSGVAGFTAMLFLELPLFGWWVFLSVVWIIFYGPLLLFIIILRVRRVNTQSEATQSEE